MRHIQGYGKQLAEAGCFIFNRFQRYCSQVPASTDEMEPSKWVKSQHGKTVPVEYHFDVKTRTGRYHLEINFDDPSYDPGTDKYSMELPHIGYEIQRNRKKIHVGHVIVSRLDAGR